MGWAWNLESPSQARTYLLPGFSEKVKSESWKVLIFKTNSYQKSPKTFSKSWVWATWALLKILFELESSKNGKVSLANPELGLLRLRLITINLVIIREPDSGGTLSLCKCSTYSNLLWYLHLKLADEWGRNKRRL